MRVKICGITNLEDACLCSEEGADALGFIFSKKSPRYIREKEAKKIVNSLGPFIVKGGVFVDESKNKVFEIASSLGLNVLQFHGKESPSYCNFFRHKFKVIKVFFPKDAPFRKKIAHYKVDAYMFDVEYEDKLRRKKLSSAMIKEISALIKEGVRVIISGGLNPDNILQIKKLSPYGVDVASGVEKFVGKKDRDLVRLFIKRAKGNSNF
jgi:phosphoribosylanthranilate isomerase